MIPDDKLKHFLGGAVIAFMVARGVFMVFHLLVAAALIGVVVAGAIGAWKEWVYDAARPEHTVDVFDFLATLFGGAVGAFIHLAL